MEQRLPLLSAAVEITGTAVLFDLGYMSTHRTPSLDLPFIIGASSPHEVPAVPLKPASRILLVDPPPPSPLRQRL
jgi:hypothetical protein